jgi:ADP-ribose pyrophosphatase YjhB (NUDIX family)
MNNKKDNSIIFSDEPWQLYNDNGEPIRNVSASGEEVWNNPDFIVSTAQVWLWKRSVQGVEILLQKRSQTVINKPGMYHISAGGFIKINETPIETAVREANEELNLILEPSKFHYVQSIRITTYKPNDIKHVYLYELNALTEFIFTDGEVAEVKWCTLDDFKKITRNPLKYNLVDQGQLYFDTLIASLEQVVSVSAKAVK